ncbi:membrane protein [Escherichia phage BUCT-XGG-1]
MMIYVFSKKCYSFDLWIVAAIAMIHFTIAQIAILHLLQLCFRLLRIEQ